MLTQYPFQVSSGAKPIDMNPFKVHGVVGSGSGSGSGSKKLQVCIYVLSALSFELCCVILDFVLCLQPPKSGDVEGTPSTVKRPKPSTIVVDEALAKVRIAAGLWILCGKMRVTMCGWVYLLRFCATGEHIL